MYENMLNLYENIDFLGNVSSFTKFGTLSRQFQKFLMTFSITSINFLLYISDCLRQAVVKKSKLLCKNLTFARLLLANHHSGGILSAANLYQGVK